MFVTINFITCSEDYKPRFEELFRTRAKAVDRMPGFVNFELLRPKDGGDTYLIMTHWEDEESFKAWTKSEAFTEGHRRGFKDIKEAKAKGEKPPVSSDFKAYEVIGD